MRMRNSRGNISEYFLVQESNPVPLEDEQFCTVISKGLWRGHIEDVRKFTLFFSLSVKIFLSHTSSASVDQQNSLYITRQAMNVYSNIEVLSCKRCCSGKATCVYIFWMCVFSLSYPEWSAPASYSHLSPAPLENIFRRYLKRARFFF
jgi:hypothetical protein